MKMFSHRNTFLWCKNSVHIKVVIVFPSTNKDLTRINSNSDFFFREFGIVLSLLFLPVALPALYDISVGVDIKEALSAS